MLYFSTTFVYINRHDGIDFDGFHNPTSDKKNFDIHFSVVLINQNRLCVIGIFLLIGNTFKFFDAYLF